MLKIAFLNAASESSIVSSGKNEIEKKKTLKRHYLQFAWCFVLPITILQFKKEA